MTDEQRTIGRLEAHVDQLREQMAAMDKKLDAIAALVEQGKGARVVIAAVGAVVGAVVSAGAAVAGLFKG